MDLALDDTIAAIASPLGSGARGIIRLSGPALPGCLEPYFQAETATGGQQSTGLAGLDRPCAIAGHWTIDEPGCGELRIPVRLYVWPTTRSFTRQPSAEIHMIGSPPLVEAVLGALCRGAVRLARPGEFTLRAFLAGRVDLTQAEAILGVVDARDRRQLDAALEQLAGGLARPLGRLREELLDVLAHVEAGLDFAEEDISFIQSDALIATLNGAIDEIERLTRRMSERHVSAGPARVVLVGWPNVGKSRLFNALSGSQAIVSPKAGTTRDYLTARIPLGEGSWSVIELIDTAGVQRQRCEGSIDSLAMVQTDRQREGAAIELLCLDSSRTMNAWEREQLEDASAARLVVLTKTDLARRTDYIGPAIETSAVERKGLDALRAAVRRRLEQPATAEELQAVEATAVRCRESLVRAGESLRRAVSLVENGNEAEELVAAELRVALDALATVVGAIYTDDILNRIFSRFCIGK